MRKPDSLRLALQAAIPLLATDPERLKIFVDNGKVVFSAGAGKGFEYRYRLTLQLLDFAGDEDRVFLAILIWLQANNEWELLQAYVAGKRDGVSFEVDVLGPDKVDLEIGLDLCERVIAVPAEGGGWTLTHPAEPPMADDFANILGGPWPGAPLETVHANADLIAPEES